MCALSDENLGLRACFDQVLSALAHVANARNEARWLLESVTGWPHATLIADPGRQLSRDQWQVLQAALERRTQGEPLAYILGSADFFGRTFRVSPAVLVPRPETELLVRCALDKLAPVQQPRCLDLGTGSGAIAVSLALACSSARVTATDLSPAALEVAQANAQMLGAQLSFHQGHWFAALLDSAQFDLIVSNPPYIAVDDPHLLVDGLRCEPVMALTDGVSEGLGLECIKAIVAGAPKHLVRGGWLLFEHGYDQGAASRNLLQNAGFQAVFTEQDFAGHDRVSGGRFLS